MATTVPSGLLRAVPRYARLLRSQYWPAEKLQRYEKFRLAKTLRAAARIPFYRDRIDPVAEQPPDLRGLPILSRSEVPDLASSVRSIHPPQARLLASRTSGSTGMPVRFFFDERHQAGRFAARARYLRANGWSPFARSAWILNIAPESPDVAFSRGPRFVGARFFSHVAPLEEQASWLRALDPVHLYAYPVNLEGLARIFAADGRRLASLRKIFSGSEVLDDALRETLGRVFGVEVADNYGSTEAFLAWQCPRGSYHVNAEHVLLEIVDESGDPSAAGSLGRVLVTTLENSLMPLVRYEIGDYAFAAEGACPCGRTLPRVGAIVGRGVNLFVDAAGNRFVPWHLFRPLKDREWVKQYQVVQRDVGRFVVRFAAARALGAEDESAVRRHFESVLGSPATIDFERLERIPRTRSGKFMTALCELPQAG